MLTLENDDGGDDGSVTMLKYKYVQRGCTKYNIYLETNQALHFPYKKLFTGNPPLEIGLSL